jgi:hypothetical protein
MAENNENMDNLNETVRKLDDSMRQMAERNEQMAAAMLAMMGNMTGTGKSMKDSTISATEAAKSLKSFQKGLDETTEAEKINAEMARKHADAMANFSKALSSTQTALTSMAGAALSGKEGFEKYNNTLKNAGDAALSLGKNFGILGTILGGVIKGFTMVGEMATKQADDLLKATDKISQTGAANKFTAEQVRQMGAKAGLASDQMDKLIKPMTSLSGGLTVLGNSSSDGVKAFTEMTAVTKEQRMAFQRLGFDDEARIKAQADYVSLLEKSGAGLSKSEKTGESLRKQSLAYAENLVVLAEMSGKNVEEMKKQQEVNRATYEWKLMENKWAMDRKAAEAAGDTDKVKRIDAERAAANKLIDDVGALGDPAKTAAVQMQYLTGAITKESANMAVLGVDVQKQIDSAKKGQYKQGEFIDEYDKKAKTMLENNRTALAFSEDLRKATGLSGETVAGVTKRSTNDKSQAEIAAGGRQAVEDNKKGKGAAAEDPAQIARNNLTEAERAAKLKVDELIASMNPLLKGFDATTIAATALATAAGIAALALTAMAGKAAMGKVGDLLGGDKGKGKGGKAPKPRGPDGRFIKAGATATKGAGMAGSLAKGASALGRVAGPAAAVVSVGMGLHSAYQGSKEVDEKVKSGELTKAEGTVKKSEAVGSGVGQAAGGAAGAWAGAAAGAAMGSVVPVIGTAIGGLLGAAVGGWLGSKGGEVVGEKVGKVTGEALKETGTPSEKKAMVEKETEARKAMSDKEVDARKDSTKSTDTLNKTYLSNKKAMEDLTQAINDLSNIATVKDQPGSAEDKAKRLEQIYARLSSGSAAGPGASPAGGSTGGAPGGTGGTGAGGNKEGGSSAPRDSNAGGPAGGHAAESSGAGPGSAPKLTRISSKSGKSTSVNEKFAPAFQGLIDYLDKSGYEINSLGGFVDRDVRGKPGVKSVHAHGGAIDINPSTNPLGTTLVTDMPGDISSVAAGLGLGWGGNWKSRKDAMHFSAAQSEGGSLLKAKNGGLFDGPTSGYDVELHGREMVIPAPDVSKVFGDKDNVEKQELSSVFNQQNSTTTQMDDSATVEMLAKLMEMMEEKMDDMIDKLSDSHSTQEQLLKYSKA